LQPLTDFGSSHARALSALLVDIDDTLTTNGRLVARAYAGLERLHDAGILVVPVTGRPAGWCDHIARMWPVAGVVGENGAFYFRYERSRHAMRRRFFLDQSERRRRRARLEGLRETILAEVPGSAVASDQAYRESDLAIDYCEDVERLPPSAVERIVALFHAAGATAKVSSIHVNGWFGDYDKLAMTRLLMRECFELDVDAQRDRFVFVGDSPNDAPMFAHFPHAIGVANVRDFEATLQVKPAYVATRRGGEGFAEIAEHLLALRAGRDG